MAAGLVYHNLTTASGVTFTVASWVPDTTAPDVGAIPVHVNVNSSGSATAFGSGANGATVPRFTVATDDTLIASLATKLDTVAANIVSATGVTGHGTAAAAMRVELPNDGTGKVGLNSQGYSARVSVTRPSDTTAYAANDVVGVTGGGTATITFANMGPAAGEIMITSATFERDASAVISGETSYVLHLFNVTQPAAQVDNAAFDLVSGDRTAYLGSINLGSPVDLGSTLYVATDGINKQITLASTSLFGVLVTVGAYTPASAAVHIVTLHSVAV